MRKELDIDTSEKLETPRLILRKPVIDDADAIFEGYARDEEVTRYLVWHAHRTPDETRSFLERCLRGWDDDANRSWVITLRETGQLIGMIDVRLECHANLGFVLGRPYWNRGYMTEAVTAVVRWAFEREDVCRVWAVCDVENSASARVLQKAGLELEGVLRRWMILPNRSRTPRDCYCYSVVK